MIGLGVKTYPHRDLNEHCRNLSKWIQERKHTFLVIKTSKKTGVHFRIWTFAWLVVFMWSNVPCTIEAWWSDPSQFASSQSFQPLFLIFLLLLQYPVLYWWIVPMFTALNPSCMVSNPYIFYSNLFKPSWWMVKSPIISLWTLGIPAWNDETFILRAP